MRYVNVSYDLKAKDQTTVRMERDLDALAVDTPNRPTPVTRLFRRYRGAQPVEERRARVRVPPSEGLKLPRGMWQNLGRFKPEVS